MKIPPQKVQSLDEVVAALRLAPDPSTVLRTGYDVLSSRYHGQRLATLTRFFELFPRELRRLWPRTGFMHCTNINRLFRHILLGSGRFSPSDIQTRWTLLWLISPHQYLRVRVGKEWVKVDVWAKVFGIPFGDYAHRFHDRSRANVHIKK